MIRIKLLFEKKKNEREEDKGLFIIDAVNEVVSSLPYGHKWRNKVYAIELMKQVTEYLSAKDIVTREEVSFLVN